MKTAGQVDDLHFGMVVDQGPPGVVVQDEELLGTGVILLQESMDCLFQKLHPAMGRTDATDRRRRGPVRGGQVGRPPALRGPLPSRGFAQASDDALDRLTLGKLLQGLFVGVDIADIAGSGQWHHLHGHAVSRRPWDRAGSCKTARRRQTGWSARGE